MKKLLLALGISTTLSTPLLADSHFHIQKCQNAQSFKQCAWIQISGNITAEDGPAFMERTKDIQTARVDLNSKGGQLLSGITIGEIIHQRGWSTYVSEGTECDSACALMWLAGKQRDMGKNAMLAFHAPLRSDDPEGHNSFGGALVGMYLRDMGFQYKDIGRFITNDHHHYILYQTDAAGKMTWRTVIDNAEPASQMPSPTE
jgi:hypothetical protein